MEKLMSEENKIKAGPPWKIQARCDSYEEAKNTQQTIIEGWSKDSSFAHTEGMRSKVKRMANGKYVVKTRVDPVWLSKYDKENKKNGSNKSKNKRNNKKGQDNS